MISLKTKNSPYVEQSFGVAGKIVLCLVIILSMTTTCQKDDEMDKFMREPSPVITITQIENSLKISWSEVPSTNNYMLDKSDNNFDDLSLFYSEVVHGTFYIDKNPVEGINYYRVRAQKCKRYDINLSSGERDCREVWSDVVSFNYTSSSRE